MSEVAFSAYGLAVEPSFDLPISGAGVPGPRVELKLGGPAELNDLWRDAHGRTEWQTMFAGDCHVRWERGREDDHLVTFGRRARFHLDAAGEALTCSPADPERLDWQQFLLETVLCCVSSVVGFEAIHASAVMTPAGVVAFVGPRSGGKSALAAELIGRGHTFFCDDVLALSRGSAGIIAHPGPPLMTIAANDAAGLPAHRIDDGEGDMAWLRLDQAAAAPAPLAAVFVLERRRPSAADPVGESAAPGRLLPHCLSLGRDPARALSLVGMLRELAAESPIYRLALSEGGLAAAGDTVEASLAAARRTRTFDVADHVSAA